MQDAEQLQEQVRDMVAKAEVRAEVAAEYLGKIRDQRAGADRELSKFRFLDEVFTLGINLMKQRRETLLQADETPEAALLEGLDKALDELERISRQAQDMAHQFNGCRSALQTLEEGFNAAQEQAATQAEGLAVHGQRAVDAASGAITSSDVESKEALVVGDEPVEPVVQNVNPGVSAKEPIASP